MTQEALKLDLGRARRDFPILNVTVHGRPLVYLDNAATAQKPQPVIDAVDRYWRTSNANIHRGVHHLSQVATAQYDAAREKVRMFLNARSSAEVIFTKGCTEAINLVAAGLAWDASDVILATQMEHHSNIVPWQLAAERQGARVVPIQVTDAGEIDLDDYRRKLRAERVKIVALVHVSNALGTINPVREMIEMAHEVGALTLVDGAQAGPHIPVDVQELGADFYTLSCHKIYAPTGVGVLYGKRALLESMPPYHGGGDMIKTVDFEGSTFAELPAKFEAGTPNVAGVIGLGAAIDYLASFGPEGENERDRLIAAMGALHERELEIARSVETRLAQLPGVRIVGAPAQKTGIVSFVMEGAHPHDIGTILDAEGIAIRAGHHCCMPLMKRLGLAATARASFGLLNDESDGDALVRGVEKVREIFA